MLSAPKRLCRNSSYLVVMFTTWQECSRTISFWPQSLGRVKQVEYQKMQFQARFHEALFLQSTLGDARNMKRFFLDLTPDSYSRGWGFWVTKGNKRGGKRFNSKFDIGSTLSELYAIFRVCFRWEAWGCAIACHRLHSSFNVGNPHDVHTTLFFFFFFFKKKCSFTITAWNNICQS